MQYCNALLLKVTFPNTGSERCYRMDSRTVCRCSAAFSRICSRMMSAFSRSTRPRALDSASTRSISFLCRSSISCSTVAAETHTQSCSDDGEHECQLFRMTPVGLTSPYGFLLLYRFFLFAQVLLVQQLLGRKGGRVRQKRFWEESERD